nr:MAG TPA: hypothetical protein [Caudoviricetes sp.]
MPARFRHRTGIFMPRKEERYRRSLICSATPAEKQRREKK